MKVLITGSSGFIGAAVTRAVVAKGDEVRVLVRPTSNRSNLDGLPVETVEGDLQDSKSLKKALTGCQGVYHVAAHYALWAQDPTTFYKVNVEGTKQLFRAAEEAGVERIVYTSTIGAIGLPDAAPGGQFKGLLAPVPIRAHSHRGPQGSTGWPHRGVLRVRASSRFQRARQADAATTLSRRESRGHCPRCRAA